MHKNYKQPGHENVMTPLQGATSNLPHSTPGPRNKGLGPASNNSHIPKVAVEELAVAIAHLGCNYAFSCDLKQYKAHCGYAG